MRTGREAEVAVDTLSYTVYRKTVICPAGRGICPMRKLYYEDGTDTIKPGRFMQSPGFSDFTDGKFSEFSCRIKIGGELCAANKADAAMLQAHGRTGFRSCGDRQE